NALAADLRRVGPNAEHEVDQPLDVGRTLHEHGKVVHATLVRSVVARMTDSSDDEAGICQSRRCRVMAPEPSLSAMRDDNERKLVSNDRAVLRANDYSIASPGLILVRAARIPNRPS